jgi:hypothetical protein
VARSRGDDALATRVILGVFDDSLPPVQVDDSTAMSLYGLQPYERRDLACAQPWQLTALARRVLVTKSSGASRVLAVNLLASTDPDGVLTLLRDAVLYARPPRLYGCTLVDRLGRTVFALNQLLQGVDVRFSTDEVELRLALANAEPYQRDVARWGADVWTDGTWGAVTTR